MPRILFAAAIAALVALVLAFCAAPSVGARELYPQRVSVVEVRGDAGFYVARLADDRVLLVTPPRSRARTAPILSTGPATLTETSLLSGGYTYQWVRQ